MTSSPILRVLDQFDEDDFIDVPTAPESLLAVLRDVPDPRHKRGIRHPVATILVVTACAVASGAKSFTAIAEWVADAAPARGDPGRSDRRRPVGVHDPPYPATRRRGRASTRGWVHGPSPAAPPRRFP